MAVPWVSWSQTTVTIGEGTATCNTNPIGTYYNYSITEQLYTADEIGMAGNITSIGFYYMGLAEKSLPITVYMKQVNDLDLATAGISLADADEVFSGTLSVTTTAGWVTIDLDVPFAYNGTSSLLIGIVKDYLYYFSGQSWQGTSTSATMARYTQNDNNAYTVSTTPSSAQSCRPNIQLEIIPAGTAVCLRPTGLAATLTPGNGTIATLNWTAGGTETYWNLSITDQYDFTFIDTIVNTTTFNVTGLTAEATYNARVRAYCGADDLSSWSNQISFTPTNTYSITVNDGTTTNGYVPIYGYYCDDNTKSQFVIPANDLANMQYGNITKMTFYSSNASISWGSASFNVYLSETTETGVSAIAELTGMAQVYSGSLSIANNVMEVVFTSPYQYMGGNLLVAFDQPVSGSFSTCNWYGVSATGASMGGYGSSVNQQNFLPKTTFAYIPGQAPACPKPTGFSVAYNGGTTAIVSWTSDANAFNLDINGTVTYNVNNPDTITGLNLGTTYTVMVQADCGTATSEWTNPVSFTTDLCLLDSMCNVTVELTDSYGDGWNGNVMNVVDSLTGNTLSSLTLSSGNSETFAVSACSGRTINFVYVASGSYGTENGWNITDINDEIIASHEGCNSGCTPDAGVQASYNVNCTVDPNPAPRNVEVTTTQTTATLNWTGISDSYKVYYRIPAHEESTFLENFESGLSNWTIYTEGEARQTDGWYTTNPASSLQFNAVSGTEVASAWSWANVAYDADNWLVSPQLTLGGTLKYWERTNGAYPDSYEVLISTTGNTLTDFANADTLRAMAVAGGDGAWNQVSINLSSYANQQGYIAILHVSNDMN